MVAIPVPKIRIVGVPPGEAPLSVRKEWVGLVLPLATGDTSAYQFETNGVVSGVKNTDATIGFRVRIEDALAVLEKKSPYAALWWRKHAGRLIVKGATLVFHENVCALIGTEKDT